LALDIRHSALTHVVLISTYDLGRQPFGLASPAAFLRAAGHEVRCVDLTRTTLPEAAVAQAGLVGLYLPMHTATRLALPVIDRIRALNPAAHICAYGLYAPLNSGILRDRGVQTVLGPEFEGRLLALVNSFRLQAEVTCSDGEATRARDAEARSAGTSGSFRLQAEDPLPRVAFITPDRSDLPPLTRYASLQVGDERRVVGYTEASRGCKHRCRHCPIVPVYDGRFRAVPIAVVLADIRAQVAAGARHITFGDPDFFNGPTHALAIVDALSREWPDVTYDVTIKVEHLRRHSAALPRLRETGCAFVTTAVESFDDAVLAKLEKGHTHTDFVAAVHDCQAIGLTLSPTFVAFTPWTTLQTYGGMLREIDRLGLVPSVSPIQYAIRLLIPEGSRMLELADIRALVEAFDPTSLTHGWRHPDPRVDALQQDLERVVGSRLNAPRHEVFAQAWAIGHAAAGEIPPARPPLVSRSAIPYLNEPWYC
jgi:radical SAM superfamily enzyme YgiQ (UPF0313 family)